MYMKICPECNKKSYSASDGSWECPHCQADLREVETQPVDNRKN